MRRTVCAVKEHFMKKIRLLSGSLLAAFVAASAQAQVYRCGDTRVYTDKPCEGAQPVDLRSNVMQAGPRDAPAPAAQPDKPSVLILPEAPRAAPTPSPSPPSTSGRTGGYR
jgi:hypothetical protein